MESAKLFTLLLVFHLSRLSRSQFGTCNILDGPNCLLPPPSPDQWVSNIRGELIPSPIGSGGTGLGEYVVQWDLDPARPSTRYIVILREFVNPGQPMVLMVPAGDSELLIQGLEIGVEYVASVCYTDTPPTQFPAFNGFTPPCGLCDLCFIVDPELSGPPPEDFRAPFIFEAERVDHGGMGGIRAVYTCEAIGVPFPDIIWEAFDRVTEETVTLERDFDGIEIFTTVEQLEVSSDLTIFTNSDFSSPTCIAINLVDVDRQRMFKNVMLPTNQMPLTTDVGVPEPFPEYAIAILVIVPIVVLILVVIIVCVLARRKKQAKIKKMVKNDDYRASGRANNLKIPVDPATTVEMSPATQRAVRKASLINKLPKNMILSSDVLQVSTIIGQGEFGVVYKGYLKQSMTDTVAVKTLKGIFVTAKDIENATAEILKMSKFDHPNVMQLIGVCLAPSDNDGGTGPCIVMPFMSKGSLLDFLRKESDNLFTASEKEPNFLDVRKQLLQFCLQVAKGMEYLASLKFIHRDLAARNCLMDANNVIKISDFGLSEDIYSQNYFRQAHGGGIKLPLKWMALESIKLGLFTEKTDVWSYGVTCWEIFNGGAIPYPGVHPQNVLSYLEDGRRLEKPKNAACCESMYISMLSFWSKKPEARPNFESIVKTLASYLITTSDYLDLSLMNDGSCQGKVASPRGVEELEEDPEHSITRVPAQANDYTMAGPSN